MLAFCCLFLLLSIASVSGDYYKTLGVTKSSTPKEIKKSYRTLSLKYHPDKNPNDPTSSQKFQDLARAYEVLSDESKKSTYDRYGEEGLKKQEANGGNGGGGDPFGGGGGGIFEQFGFRFPGQQQRGQGERKTEDIMLPLKMTLKQLYLGDILEVDFVREVVCMNWKECTKKDQSCQAPGIKLRTQQLAPGFVQQVQVRDETCVARGESWRSNCKACPKGRTEPDSVKVTIDVNKGMRDQEPIVFEGIADEKVGMTSGDLIFVIQELKHEYFRRDGDNLYATVEIPLVDALVGFTHKLDHLDGHEVVIKVDDVTECDMIRRVQGEGMPRRSGNGRGDLFVTFEVDFPTKFTKEQKEGLEKILRDVE